MKFMMFFLIPVFLPFCLSANEMRGQGEITYDIQLGAYKQYLEDNFLHLEEYGSLHTKNTKSGLTRVRIGHYESQSEAKQALKQIQANGFRDAFVVTSVSHPADLSAELAVENYSRPETMPIWQQLSNEQRRNVVYLDGVLYMKEGNDFISLSEYIP